MAFDWSSAVVEDRSSAPKFREKPVGLIPVGNGDAVTDIPKDEKKAVGEPEAVAELEPRAAEPPQAVDAAGGFDWGSAVEADKSEFDWGSAVEEETPGRVTEFLTRISRGARLGVEDVKAGLYGVVEGFTEQAENPYRGMGEEQLTEKRAELLGYLNDELDAEARQDGSGGVNPTVQSLRHSLQQVDDSRTGHAPWEELTAGAVGALAESAQENKAEIGKEYAGRISPSRDTEYWMQVADSVGSSLPGTGAAMLNPLLGLSMMFAQTYEGARSEFAGSEKGKSDGGAAHEYALKQAAYQTPWEVVGDLAFAGLANKALGGFLKGNASPKAIGTWIKDRAVELTKAAAGETLVTTPAQTLGEQMLAESAGLRAATSAGEKAGQVGNAMKLAAGQSLLMGGGPVAVEGAVRTAAGGFSGGSSDELTKARDLGQAAAGLADVKVEGFDWASAVEVETPAEASTGLAARENAEGVEGGREAVQGAAPSVDPKVMMPFMEYGAKIYQAGMDFAAWSGRMVARFGESVKEFLEAVWESVSGGNLLPHARDRAAVILPDGAGRDPVKKRGFIRSVQAEEAGLPSVKERVQGVYEPLSNKETVAAAREWINQRGLDGALAGLLASDRPTAQEYAAGIELMGRLQAGGRFEDAAALVERMAETATGQGQAIQALSLLSKLTSEGIQFYAQKVIRRAVEKNPLLAKLHGEVSRLRGELRKARATMAQSAVVEARVGGGSETVQQRLQGLLVGNPGSVWGRYKQGAVKGLVAKLLGPGKSREEPGLELFTGRLRQQLREKLNVDSSGRTVRAAELSEAEMIGEAVRNFDKYREVWEDAQAHVREAYKGKPEVLQGLDGFLGEILDRPFSDKSVGRAVRQVLDELNATMREVMTQGAGDKGRLRKALQGLIVERAGLSGVDAGKLADAIGKEFDQQQVRSREQLLKAMVKTGAVQVPKSQLERLIGLNNAGALDDSRFFSVLAKHYGIPAWTPELSSKVQRLQREHEAAKDPEVKLAKAAQMFDAVHELVPADAWARVRSVQNIALLLNPKTLIRNIGGNVVLFAADVPADAVSGWVVDPLVSLVTGQRTRRSVDVAARLGGLAAPVKDFWKGRENARDQGFDQSASLRAGVDQMLTMARLSARGKYDLGQVQRGNSRVFSSQAGRMLEDALTVALSSFDRSFHQAAFKGSVMRQMKVAAAGGVEMVAPSKEMIDVAMIDAARATFQDENFASRALGQIAKAVNLVSTLGMTNQYGLGSVVLPFTQVPGSILMRGVEWSPLGFIRSAYEVFPATLTGKEFRQKEFVDSFTRAAMGSAGVGLGVFLYKLGIMTALGDEDKDVEAMRRDSGLGAFRLNTSALKRALITGNWWRPQTPQDGDVTVNYDWLQPTAMPLAMGGAIMQKLEEDRRHGLQGKGGGFSGMGGLAASGAKAAVLTLENQPLLTGVARWARDVGRDGAITGTAMQALDAPSMFVPTIVGQFGQLMDNQVRETRAGGPWDQAVNRLLARIPGISGKYPPRYDVFGEAQERYGYGGNSLFNVMLNPAFIERVKMTPELKEMEDVFRSTGDNAGVPKRAPVKLSVLSQRVEMTNEQISQYQHLSGQLTVRAYARLAASPEFAAAAPGVKVSVLEKVMSGISKAVKLQVLKGNPDLQDRLRAQIIQRKKAEEALMEAN